MTHKRKTIRDAVVALLEADTIVAAGKVFSTRALAIRDDSLPCINVMATSETSFDSDTYSDLRIRSLQLSIEIIGKLNDTTDEGDLDNLSDDVENAMDAVPQPGGAISHTFNGFNFSQDKDGEVTIGRLTLNYSVLYQH